VGDTPEKREDVRTKVEEGNTERCRGLKSAKRSLRKGKDDASNVRR
jgi:hypothetical protein